jgi:signal transduction histidine kinase
VVVAVGWSIAAAASALVVTALLLGLRNAEAAGRADQIYVVDVWVGLLFPAVGAWLLSRDPRDRVGWLLVGAVLAALEEAAGQYGVWATHTVRGGAPFASAAAWLACWIGMWFLVLMAVVPLVFPDRRPAWRPLFWLVIGVLAVATMAAMLAPGPVQIAPRLVNPLGIEAAPWLRGVVGGLTGLTALVLAPACLVAVGLRWHRARGGNRHRLGWFAVGHALMLTTLLTQNAWPPPWGDVSMAAGFTAYAAAIVIPRQGALVADALRAERAQLVHAREEERRRLHRDLHDDLGPELAGVALQLSLLTADATDPAVAERIEQARGRLRAAVGRVRRIVENLRPAELDGLGLLGAVTRVADGLGPAVSCQVVADPLPKLPAAVETAAYRIAAEAVTNVARHAGATRCTIRLQMRADVLLVEVADNGCGLHPLSDCVGVGLSSMRARAEELGGWFAAGPGPAGGTLVRAGLPLRPGGGEPGNDQ